jgi:hypothetical protein
VTAARQALDAGDVDLVLPFVHADGEAEVRATFEQVVPVRNLGPEARGIADRLFFETVVRVHRSGEGASYTGLRPAGLSVGPVIPLAEHAIEENSSEQLADFLDNALREELRQRLDLVHDLARHRDRSLEAARGYVEAMLSFEVYSHHLYQAIRSATQHEGARAETASATV